VCQIEPLPTIYEDFAEKNSFCQENIQVNDPSILKKIDKMEFCSLWSSVIEINLIISFDTH
jgi:hypothetical protein